MSTGWTQGHLLGLPCAGPPEVSKSIHAFCGSANPLLNLHICPEGCTWSITDTEYDSVEKEFQHNKIQTHDLPHEAEAILSLPTPRDIMYKVHDLVPQISEQWEKQEMMVMEICCCHKFDNCSHAQMALLQARSDIVEATLDKKCGSGLDVQRTQECHPD